MDTLLKRCIGFSCAGLMLYALSGCEGELTEATGVASDRPFAYVVRDFPAMGDTSSVDARPPLDPRSPYQFNPGAKMMVRDRIALDSTEQDILASYFGGGSYDVKDLDVAPDGDKLVFAAHGPEGHSVHSTWSIYEYSFSSGKVRRIFSDDETANLGNDTNPTYANDGRIIFSSDRQVSKGDYRVLDIREYIEDFDEPASLLHVVNSDGSELQQITFGEFHDIEPSTMDDGQIVFIRFGRTYEVLEDCTLENIDDPNFNTHPHGGGYGQGNGNGFPPGLDKPKEWTVDDKCGASVEGDVTSERVFVEDIFSLYRITPNGGNLHRYFGTLHEEFSDASYIQYMDPIPMPDGNLVTIMRHIYNPVYGGDVVKINSKNFYAVDRPVDDSVTGEAEESMTPGLVNFYPSQVSPNGWYSGVAPYDDGSNRLLVGWAQCLVVQDGLSSPCEGYSTVDSLGEPQYGVWAVDPVNNTRLPVVKGHGQALFTDIAIGKLNDRAKPYTGIKLEQILDDNTAAFSIRSVYDRDGIDMAEPDGGIVTLRDPSQTHPDDRSERFIRVLGKRSIPGDLEQAVLNNSVLNPTDGSNPKLGLTPILGSGGRGLYDVLSYAMVEPDGSAMVKVPAETGYTFEVVNQYGKRVDLIASPDYHYNYLVQHPTSLLLEKNEVLGCVGCHDPENDIPHARTDVPLASANPGAPGDGMAFPNANTQIRAIYWQDTMADALIDYLGDIPATWANIMSFEDFWGNPPDAGLAFSNRYEDLTTPVPVNDPACLTEWNSNCKATINYLEHIQPIWDVCRTMPGGELKSCTSCHDKADSTPHDKCTGGGGSGGDLILSGDPAPWDPRQVQSYVELFKPDYYQKNVDGDWIEVDPTTDCPDGVQGELTVLPDSDVCFSRRLMSARGAIASARFFSLFDDDPDDDEYEVDAVDTTGGGSMPDHMGLLTEVELRLIAEWLDSGAHLYNDTDKYVLPEE
ncbi:PD40 domain-containing protein [Hahella ganghwensis]|uniref:PD40 domain-containing protein n=1 Tax=Hahella ganghwensis TaxID=286420 RepID=UPI000368EB7A|nr:PD40 domain-containing protein [Hahella ganghwensis]